MKKFGLLLIILLVLGVALLVVVISSGGTHAPLESGVPSADATGGLRDKVIGVALADPVVQKILNSSDKKPEPEYIKPGDTGVYVKNSTRYAGVSFHTSAGLEPISLKVIVDTSTMNEMGVYYSGLPPLMNSWIIIPSGNGIYEMMVEGYNLSWPKKYAVPEISSGVSGLNLTPEDAELYPLILDEDNFKKYMNGSAYDVPDLLDPDTGETVRFNGSTPVTSGWRSLYVLPPERQSYKIGSNWTTWYYQVLLNNGSSDIKIVYWSPWPPIYE